MEGDEVNSIQNGLSPAVGLETVSHFGNGDKDTEGRKALFGGLDLGSEFVDRQDMIEQGFGTELDGPGDKLGLGVIVESRKKSVPASLPYVAVIKTELERRRVSERRSGSGAVDRGIYPNHGIHAKPRFPCDVNDVVA